MINIIAAMDSKRGLGKNNQMAWNIPGELKRFKEITTPHSIIMGRKTYESIGRVLPGRTNIIITRNQEFKVDGAIVVDSIENAINEAKKDKNSDEIFIIGGGQIFAEAMEKSIVDRLYLTIVEGDYNCDTFFPNYKNFKVISEQKGESTEFNYKFLELIK